MSKVIELADAYAVTGPLFASQREARAALAAEIERVEAEIEVGAQQMRWMMHSHNKSFDDFTEKVAALEAENAKLRFALTYIQAQTHVGHIHDTASAALGETK